MLKEKIRMSLYSTSGLLEDSAMELSFRVTCYRIIVSWHPAARADGNDRQEVRWEPRPCLDRVYDVPVTREWSQFLSMQMPMSGVEVHRFLFLMGQLHSRDRSPPTTSHLSMSHGM